jgi:hypothetical protein
VPEEGDLASWQGVLLDLGRASRWNFIETKLVYFRLDYRTAIAGDMHPQSGLHIRTFMAHKIMEEWKGNAAVPA